MLFLRTTLWITLVITTVWLSLIFFGARLVHEYIKIKYGEDIIIEQLEITPMLDLRAAYIELSFPSDTAGQSNKFGARGIRFDWSIRNGYLEMRSQIKAVNVENLIQVRDANFTFKLSSLSDLEAIPTNLLISTISTPTLNISNINFESHLDLVSSSLSNAEGRASELTYRKNILDIHATDIGVQFNRYNFREIWPIKDTQFTLEMPVIGAFEGGVTGYNVGISGKFNQRQLDLVLNAKRVFDPHTQIIFDNVALEQKLNSQTLEQVGPLKLAIDRLTKEDDGFEIKNFRSTTSNGPPFFEKHEVSFHSVNVPLEISGRYIGQIQDASVDLSAVFTAPHKVDGSLTINFNRPQKFTIESRMVADLAVHNLTAILLNFREDSFDTWEAEFTFSTPEGKLIGRSFCPPPDCALESSEHSLATDNTADFFSSLSSLELLSPLSLALAYSVMLDGNVLGKGHKITLP